MVVISFLVREKERFMSEGIDTDARYSIDAKKWAKHPWPTMMTREERFEKDDDEDAQRTTTTADVARPRRRRKFHLARALPARHISISYILFTITDGAVRMVVVLHAYSKSFTAMELAIVFTLYELMGVVTNLIAGIMGARWGIRMTLLIGLALQIGGLGMLFAWTDEWSKTKAMVYVTAAQALCGIAKDLTKLVVKRSRN